jgi:hypothetical protein
MEHRIQLLGAEASKIKNRERALARYYASPGETIHPRDGEKPGLCKKKKFCSHSCAASYNNHFYPPKRERTGQCRQCSKPVLVITNYCSKQCRNEYRSNNKKPRTKTEGQHVVNFRKNIKKRAVEYMGGKCVKCGYDRCVWSLQFHHLDPTKKEFNISSVKIRSWDKIKAELEKCVLICSNCHGEIHAGLLKI